MTITDSTILSRNGEILYSPVGKEEAVMMSVEAGKYYGLNAVAARVWEILEQPMSVRDVCERIAEEFDTDPKSCAGDVIRFADDLVSHGILNAA